MTGDIDSLRAQLSKLETKIEQLMRRIDDLVAEKESQEIVIEALVNQAKMTRKRSGEPRSVAKRPRASSKESSTEVCRAVPAMAVEEVSSAARDGEKAGAGQDASDRTDTVSEAEGLTRQIKDVFYPKLKNVDFKINYTFKRFVEYAESSYEFSLTNKKVSRPKNPLKLYIETNLDKIVKYIMDNANALSLNQICSTLFLINSGIDYRHKLIIAHDLLLLLESSSKALYIFSALFNNLELQEDEFSVHIKKILYHQYCIDTDTYSDDAIASYLELIKNNFSLQRPAVSLWESPRRFLVNESLFSFSKVLGKAKVRCECIERGFMLRMLCHYIDWDFTYNQFIVGHLFPLLLSERSSVLAYYAGILAMNAYRVFGKDESVASIFTELLSLMGDDSDTSVVCYLLLKQVFEADCARWLENNEESLVRRGFDTEDLCSLLLL